MSLFQKTIDFVNGFPVRGWLTEKEAVFLAMCASRAPGDLAVVEVGAYRGLSTVFLGSGAHEGNMPRVYSVDHHPPMAHSQKGVYGPMDMQEYYRNISAANVGQHIYSLCIPSIVAASIFAPESVSLLWVDGDHSKTAVLLDIHSWLPKVIPGGLILFHDRDEDGVCDALQESPDHLKILGVVDGMAVCQNHAKPFSDCPDWPLELIITLEDLVEMENAADPQ